MESDLELLLPADYVTGSSERMLLYRELDGLTLDKDVDAFRSRLEDRFGPIPPETEELLRIVPLRRLAARLGVEKVFLKGGRMSLFFVSNPDSPYYQSQAFGKVIAYMMKYTRRCEPARAEQQTEYAGEGCQDGGRSCLCVAGGSGNAGGGVTVATPATNVRTARRIPN